MGRYRAQAAETQDGQHIAIEIISEGKEQAPEVLRVTAPDGFPPERLHQLADYWARGFNEAYDRLGSSVVPAEPGAIRSSVDLSEFASSLRGRPRKARVEEIGQKASELHEKGMTYSEIVRALFPKDFKNKKTRKKRADSIRQAVKQYETREYLDRLAKGEIETTPLPARKIPS